MSISFVCESLERRDHFSATPSARLDPDYLFDASKVRAAVGRDLPIFQALPGRDGRTYLLSVRPRGKENDPHSGLLTLFAVAADGNLDPSFGSDGVALTGRKVVYQDTPGLLKTDGRGRLYFGESTRIVRFKSNGSTDRTFGHNGSADFATADRPVQLCDFTPTDDGGVLVATTSTTKGVQRFAVQKIARKIRTTWQTSYDTGSGENVDGRINDLAVGQAQFAANAGQTVLARVHTVGKVVPEPDIEVSPSGKLYVPTRSDAIVTRFDVAGSGADVARKELHLPKTSFVVPGAAIGTGDYRFPNLGNTLLYKGGRSLLLLTDAELVQFDLDTGRAKWIAFPKTRVTNDVSPNARFQLFPDGTLGAQVYLDYSYTGASTAEIERFNVDGTKFASFADGGRVTIKDGDYPVKRPEFIDQMFLGTDERVYFMASGTSNYNPSTLTLRRN